MRRSYPLRGFTLVELLVVIAIIGLLMAIVLPAVNAAKETARKAQCVNNQKEIGLAALQYESNKSKMPGSWANINVTANGNANGNTQFTVAWPVLLFPYMARNDLYTAVTTNGSAAVMPALINSYICPSIGATGGAVSYPLNYVANCGQPDSAGATTYPFDWQENGVFFDQRPGSTAGTPNVTTTLSYINKWDGASNTLLLSENVDGQAWWNPGGWGAAGSGIEWQTGMVWFPQYDISSPPPVGLDQKVGQVNGSSSPAAINFARPSAKHRGGYNVTMCDGSVRFLSDQVPYFIYGLLMTPRGAYSRNTGGTSFTTYQPQYIIGGQPSAGGQLHPISETDLTQ